MREKSERSLNGDDAEDEEEEDEIEEELGYFSALDNVDPYIVFKQALTGQLTFFVLCGALLTSVKTSYSFPDAKRGAVSGCHDLAECRATYLVDGGHAEGRSCSKRYFVLSGDSFNDLYACYYGCGSLHMGLIVED